MLLAVSVAWGSGRVETEAYEADPGPSWGDRGPVSVVAADPDGRSLASCQARADTNGDGELTIPEGALPGDSTSLYLMTPERPLGEVVEWFLGSDAGGDRIAMVRDGVLIDRDLRTGLEIVLAEPAPFERPLDVARRFGGYSEVAHSILLVRHSGRSARVVAHDLTTHVERIVGQDDRLIGSPDIEVQRVDVVGDGWVNVLVNPVPCDEKGDGKLNLHCFFSDGPGPCAQFESRQPAAIPVLSGPDYRLLRLSDGQLESRVVLAATPGALLVRGGDGSLRRVPAIGEETEIAPSSCRGDLLAISERSEHFLVRCAASDGTGNVLTFDPSSPHGRPIRLSLEGPRWVEGIQYGRMFRAGRRQLVDLVTAGVLRLNHDVVLGEYDGFLVRQRRSGAIVRTDLGARTSRRLGRTMPTSTWTRFGRFLAIRSRLGAGVLDIASGGWIGRTEDMPALVRSDGWALVPAARVGDAPWGPLNWMRPPHLPEPGDVQAASASTDPPDLDPRDPVP